MDEPVSWLQQFCVLLDEALVVVPTFGPKWQRVVLRPFQLCADELQLPPVIPVRALRLTRLP